MSMRAQLRYVVLSGVVALALLSSGCSSASPTRPSTATASQTPATARHSSTTRAPAVEARTAPPPHSSPFAPPFGYCGGLRTISDARYIVSSGLAVALVRATLSGRGRRIVRGTRATRVNRVTLLAGRLTNGPVTKIDTIGLHAGRYVLLIGGGRGDYYVAAGLYGTFRPRGSHAYRVCNDFDGKPDHLVRSGITTISGLTRLFAHALR